MRRSLARLVEGGGLAVGGAALVHSDWFHANAPAFRTQLERGVVWSVWPQKWGAAGEAKLAAGRQHRAPSDVTHITTRAAA